jgi:Ca2+-transporting ATPase
MAFSTITLARILQTLPARSNEYNLIKLGFFSNMYVIYAIISCILIYGLTLLPLARGIFSIPLDFGFEQLGICIGLALLSTAIMELVKFRHKNEI